MMPVRPAIRNWNRNPTQNSIGVLNWILPPHMVPSQLKILIPVGTPTAIVVIAKKLLAYELIPIVNMWCAQTLMLTKAMQTVAPTMTGYPKIGLRENTGIISEANAKQGMIRTYTSGCPNTQKKRIHKGADPPAGVAKKGPP